MDWSGCVYLDERPVEFEWLRFNGAPCCENLIRLVFGEVSGVSLWRTGPLLVAEQGNFNRASAIDLDHGTLKLYQVCLGNASPEM